MENALTTRYQPINSFSPNNSHSDYHMEYNTAKQNIDALAQNVNTYRKNIDSLITHINDLKAYIDVQQYINEANSISKALGDAVSAMESNFRSLLSSCLKLVEDNIQADAQFEEDAKQLANYISQHYK